MKGGAFFIFNLKTIRKEKLIIQKSKLCVCTQINAFAIKSVVNVRHYFIMTKFLLL